MLRIYKFEGMSKFVQVMIIENKNTLYKEDLKPECYFQVFCFFRNLKVLF